MSGVPNTTAAVAAGRSSGSARSPVLPTVTESSTGATSVSCSDAPELGAAARWLAAHRIQNSQVPVPLSDKLADRQALKLRATGLTYGAIAIVMGSYHGVWLAPQTWRARLRRAGAAPRYHSPGAFKPRRAGRR